MPTALTPRPNEVNTHPTLPPARIRGRRSALASPIGLATGLIALLPALLLVQPCLAQTAVPTSPSSASATTGAESNRPARQTKKANTPAQKKQGSQAAGKKTKAAKTSAATAASAAVLIGTGPAYAERPEAMDFAEQIARQRQLPIEWVRQAMAQARHSPTVVRLMQPPSSPLVKNWRVYRSRFLDEVRIEAGLRFWRTHEKHLRQAESTYGVPAEIVVGIIGVETLYGRHMGQFRVLDALATLAFDFPARHPRAAERSDYFRKELEQFLVAQHRSRGEPTSALGSYAGATGMPQFMPSSIAHFAVDFDGDGQIDLANSIADVVGSVAHYLKAFNWKTGMPTHYPVELKPDADLPFLLAPDILPTFSAQVFQEKGAVLSGAATAHGGPLALIELLNGADAPSFVAGTENFYVITRYNWSSYYAMAVIDLAQEIARRRSKPAP